MMVVVYGVSQSGNCYKARLLLELLNKPYRWVEVDMMNGAHKTPEFLAKNPNGKVPIMEIEPGRVLAESNAILCYLAWGTDYLPNDCFLNAQVMQWLFFEQYSHEPYIATSRFWLHFLKDPVTYKDKLTEKKPGGIKALQVMEQHLRDRNYFVGDRLTIADIGLYAYTHVAPEGGFPLDDYQAIRAWLKRIEAAPGYVGMD